MSVCIVMLCLAWMTVKPCQADTLQEEWATPERIAAIQDRGNSEARADWWGFDVEDSTRFLQAALDSGARKIIIPNLGTPWVTGPLMINRDGLEVFFELGTLVLAKEGAFRGAGDCLFQMRDREKIIFRGHGATLRMRREDYTRPPYAKGEWRNAISILGCTDVKILGLTIESSGGDGIYIGVGSRNYCRDIEIRNIVADRNHRQGISVISVENLLIADSVLKRTSGTNPMAGIDFEPNKFDQRLVNIVMRNVATQDNGFAGFFLWLNNLTPQSLPISIRFENCTSSNDHIGVGLRRMGGTAPVRGVVEFINVRVTGSQAAALLIEDKCPTNSLVRFNRCIFSGSQGSSTLALGGGKEESWGGIEFKDTVVEDWEERPAISLSGKFRASDVTGTLLIRTPHAVSAQVKILPDATRDNLSNAGLNVVLEEAEIVRPPILDSRILAELQKLRPLHQAPLKTEPDPVRIRNSHAYALFAEQGEPVALTFNHFLKRSELELRSPSGIVLEQAILTGKQDRKIAFQAPETGVYLVTVAAPPYGGGSATLRSTARISVLPHLFNQRDLGRGTLIESVGSLYFWVPKGMESFSIRVQGWLSEPEGFRIINPDGNTVAEQKKVTSKLGHTFTIRPDPAQTGRAWQIEKSGAGDYRILLSKPLPPLFATHPDALLVSDADFSDSSTSR